MNGVSGLVRLFLRFLALIGVEVERVFFRLYIHESADVEAGLIKAMLQ